MSAPRPAVQTFETEHRLRDSFRNRLGYSCVWEDHRLVEQGLDIGPEDDLLTICSAGCNVLNLLLQQPRRVVAVDLNFAQAAQLHLKVAAARSLSWHQFVDLLGVGEAADREALYRRVRPALAAELRQYWDHHLELLEPGLLHAGALERHFDRFRRECLEPRVGTRNLRRFLELDDLSRQRAFFERFFANPRFREDFRRFFGRRGLSRSARRPEQFRFVPEQEISDVFFRRFEAACTRLPARSNLYLHFFLRSRYRDPEQGPPYLRRRNWDSLRHLLDRLEIVEAGLSHHLDQVPPGTYSKANLSDLCEYLPWHEHRRLLASLAARLRPGGRLVFWNLLVPRPVPPDLAPRLQSRSRLAARLHAEDRVWFYRSFHVEEISQ